jgi:predicted nucleic acid-binding protein
MIASDTSSLVAYLQGQAGSDIPKLEAALSSGDLVIPPVVLTELLSDPGPASTLKAILPQLILLELTPGYWTRAGETRQGLIRRGLKARIADALIAQACIDHEVPIITRDHDFQHFVQHCGLMLA